jgi:hypothetical protein
MKRFIFNYHSSTLASVARRAEQQRLPLPMLRFDYSTGQTLQILRDSVEPAGINLHRGLTSLVQNEASSWEEAEAAAKNLTEHLLNLVTLSTMTFCNGAELISAIEFPESGLPHLRSYTYPLERTELLGSLTPINAFEFNEIFDAFNKSADQQRVARALSWFRKGINEDNVVDEFSAYWIGLEVIASVLRKMLKMRMRDPQEWDGLKDVYEGELGLTDFEQVKETRHRLFHGFEQINATFIREIASCTVPTRRALIAAIARILNVSQSTRVALLNKDVRRLRRNPWIVLSGTIENLPGDFDAIVGSFPTVHATSRTPSFVIDDQGGLTMRSEITQTFSGPGGAAWHASAIEHWGDQDSGIKTIRSESAPNSKPDLANPKASN